LDGHFHPLILPVPEEGVATFYSQAARTLRHIWPALIDWLSRTSYSFPKLGVGDDVVLGKVVLNKRILVA